MVKKINIRPTTGVYATYKNIKYDPATAIAEFVDNSTQSYYDNKEKLKATKYWKGLNIEIIYEKDLDLGEKLVIKDNAFGMDFNDFKRAIVLDSPPLKASRSEFGMGLKTAACWFGLCWSVESTTLGSPIKYKTTINVEALHKYKNEEIEVEEEECNLKEHGTVITIWNLNRKLHGRQIGKTKDQLRGIYRADIRSNEINIYYNGEILRYEDPQILVEKLPDGFSKKWQEEIAFSVLHNEEEYPVKGFIALRETASTSDAGLVLLRHGRVILGGYNNNYRPEEVFEKSNSFVYQRLFGELSLDGWPVTQTKDAFDWYDGLEEEFIDKLLEISIDYRKKAKEYRKGRSVKFDEDINSLVEGFARAGIIKNTEVRPLEKVGTQSISRNCESKEESDIAAKEQIDVLDRNESGKTIIFECNSTSYKFNLILKNDDYNKQWLCISEEINKNEYDIEWNIRHPFFLSYLEEPEFMSIMEQFIFAFSLAEIESTKTSDDGISIPPGAIRMKMNEMLKRIMDKGRTLL